MTTSKQDKDFISSVVSDSLLEMAIDWIGKNMEPEEVFREEELNEWAATWAENNGWVKP